MPRITNAARAGASEGHATPIKIPLNDDRREKANRLQSRQAMHEQHMSSLKAATATPIRHKRRSMIGAAPGTPGGGTDSNQTNNTPVKRVPILANFEEWMKMATDNKINAQNSWNFALIDYFHDMSLLKEGNSVNFQKASCTLDGCVKIYTSRVDSVATETGKLLSGLAESKAKEASNSRDEDGGDGSDGEGEGDGDDEDGDQRRPRKRVNRSAEATLAKSFSQLQAKKLELDFNVDPLLKKASADFDEGGAKGLLMNQLSIDSDGRIVFSSKDDVPDSNTEDQESSPPEQMNAATEKDEDGDEAMDTIMSDVHSDRDTDSTAEPEVNIARLGAMFFPNLAVLDNLDICPTFKDFSIGETDTKTALPMMNLDNWKGLDESHEEGGHGDMSGIFLDGDSPMGFDDDDDDGIALDLGGAEIGFGDGGEAWAKEAALDTQVRPLEEVVDVADGDEDGDAFGPTGNKPQFGVVLRQGPADTDNANILNYFDEALHQNWAGPEHWRIRRIKDVSKTPAAATSAPKRREKEVFTIDFDAPMSQSLADLLYTEASTTAAISLPRAQWRSKTRNLLPDDKHFNSRNLLQLFTKPKARIGMFRSGVTFTGPGSAAKAGPESNLTGAAAAESMDEEFWARKNHEAALAHAAEEQKAWAEGQNGDGGAGTYDANFFQDDDDGMGMGGLPPGMDDDDDFADGGVHMPLNPHDGHRSMVGDGAGAAATATGVGPGAGDGDGFADRTSLGGDNGGFDGPPLVIQTRRFRPDYVQYARTAKRVDVRRLKEEMWKGIGFGDTPLAPAAVLAEMESEDRMDVDGDEGEEEQQQQQQQQQQLQSSAPTAPPDQELKFTDVIKGLAKVYPRQSMADISTSYCFICLLHLANEKGLVIENTDGFDELLIRRDWSAVQPEVAGM